MAHHQLILASLLLTVTACIDGTRSLDPKGLVQIGDTDTSTEFEGHFNTRDSAQPQEKRVPERSELINPNYPPGLLSGSWYHRSTDARPAFTIDSEFFSIDYGDTIVKVPFILRGDSIEIFERHDGETSTGIITKLTKASLVIKWTTGDVNRYVARAEHLHLPIRIN